MAELAVCAVATAATPAVLFATEQAQKLADRRLTELNASINDALNSANSKLQEEEQKNEERTLTGTLHRWAQEADQLILQRSSELTQIAVDLLRPEKPVSENSELRRRSRRCTSERGSGSQADSDSSRLSEDTDPENTDRHSKVSFDENPETTYIFRPAAPPATKNHWSC
eukprot:gnl/MRDRNA2_/MRDRNA2_171453_c0_seq1.p1 gnl/MRDRNA2_/MRDRNA2_171453_c0~~gnl/MRDRNA2_/MRDRNA2_171453_c0_seq1.p1  ORF type:complete len:170 (-),score=36.93 gnl/MRDRNA2_/MRDRNA2_171453_c0_seq1:16-525(-)